MGKKRRILIAALLVVLLSGLGWWLLRPREPSYQGKPLSAWLHQYSRPSTGTPQPESDEAIRHIGTNAIPTLLRMLRAKDSQLKTECVALFYRQNWLKIRIPTAGEENYQACRAFGALGADAANAVPDLIRIFEEKISPASEFQTARSIGQIGPPAKSAIPSLLRGLTPTNGPNRYGVVWALGMIHGQPELVVPGLVKLLRDPDLFVAQSAARVLVGFGTNAEPAIPDLIVMLKDQNPSVRLLATNTLKQIDPEAATKAGVK